MSILHLAHKLQLDSTLSLYKSLVSLYSVLFTQSFYTACVRVLWGAGTCFVLQSR
ncbi:hypothetical protein M422DRAFT_277295 [Sphaerobolus stellatus SS14]|uniref:Unplaced genomic scaffold SPHSTscaffold_1332, whole genome shotgun sequence n=1 Tax=Sphaerobolus stellatus (strain SS14) TaxID=990650 RepID=A0A0C9U9V7_SPHS4|nr:hypothetical protein M422DRAFT_277295 [Sphaerobolus stellatus SS14]